MGLVGEVESCGPLQPGLRRTNGFGAGIITVLFVIASDCLRKDGSVENVLLRLLALAFGHPSLEADWLK